MKITDQTILDRIEEYFRALTADAPENYASFRLENKDTQTHRIIANLGGQIQVHAFVDADGNLYKPAGWPRPVNTPVYNFLDDESFKALIGDASWCGRHLYFAQQSYQLDTSMNMR